MPSLVAGIITFSEPPISVEIATSLGASVEGNRRIGQEGRAHSQQHRGNPPPLIEPDDDDRDGVGQEDKTVDGATDGDPKPTQPGGAGNQPGDEQSPGDGLGIGNGSEVGARSHEIYSTRRGLGRLSAV